MEPLETTGSIVAFLIYVGLLYQQNRIMQRQNEIMERQERNRKPVGVVQRPYRFYWPMIVMGLLTVVTVTAVGIYWYSSLNSLPEDTEESSPVRDYEWAYVPKPVTGQASGSCSLLVNGKRFYRWSNKYRLAFACFTWNGDGDIDDSAQVLFSKSYEIQNDMEQMLLYWTPSFHSNMKPTYGMNLKLFMVPVGIDIEHASTVRQAKATGARQVWHGATKRAPEGQF